ncbi:50S ribosomal protein L4 [Helicobacter monodelphidis]|uniref:50S ribosomal protein L4 n=1 Tax=Helicobacter sp. 15-1451 TaxID=2004995 RepID=UPI000DCAF2C3|nr:50S ribosomal protein L4 [Helicobacter sp. 15-1451]RAX57105.1 50S ribosomal protein L4 [Helicobacter sp. 15-1451]
MSGAVILDTKMQKGGEINLPERYKDINQHNLYLYVKFYLASFRNNCAMAKTRSEVSGGGKKPWRQKGGGRARAGSITSPVFVGGGVAHGPSNNRNYNVKINKKQKKLALEYALFEKAQSGKLYAIDKIEVVSGKTKDAMSMFKALNERDTLFIAEAMTKDTALAFRNLKSCYLVNEAELNAYLIAAYRSVVIEKSILEKIIKEG